MVNEHLVYDLNRYTVYDSNRHTANDLLDNGHTANDLLNIVWTHDHWTHGSQLNDHMGFITLKTNIAYKFRNNHVHLKLATNDRKSLLGPEVLHS
jgi:hypothetical protein